MKSARLVLEDGRVFPGRSFGAEGPVVAEVVFNTSHTGYQEVLSDPSYTFQAVCFTVPILGIYGVAGAPDAQSVQPRAAAIICREVSRRASNWRSSHTLPDYLSEHGVAGIEGVDTRTLVKHLRDEGAKMGVVSAKGESVEDLVAMAKAAPRMNGLDLAKEVTTAEPYPWAEGFGAANTPWGGRRKAEATSAKGRRVVVVDFGVKQDILRHLAARGMELTVVPASTTAEAILERQPDGVMLSNGPGDPAAVTYGIETVQGLLKNEGLPIYGVCLGYQILTLALGARTLKMKFGHRGGNHPVRENDTGRVLITSHNHGFAVDPTSLEGTPLIPTYESLFDGTLEGVRHTELPVAAVQFHPESAPGPHEAGSFFDAFATAVAGAAAPTKKG